MAKIAIKGESGKWTVEYACNRWDPNVVNVFDTFEAAVERAKAIAPLLACDSSTREGILTCLTKQILDGLEPIKQGEGRGDLVSVKTRSGSHRFVSRRTARRYGLKQRVTKNIKAS